MKLAGIVRRIDELGRIVIPKEIRKTLHIKNGENLEIFINDGNIILKKYSELGNIKELSDTIAETLNQTLETINLTKTEKEKGNIIISPIISSGDALGAIILITDKEINNQTVNTINLLSNILAKHIEN